MIIQSLESFSGYRLDCSLLFDVVRHEMNAEVNRLWRVARTATEAAEAAEDAFFQKYGDPFSEDSDDSDDSQ